MAKEQQYWDCDECAERYPYDGSYTPFRVEDRDAYGDGELWLCDGCHARQFNSLYRTIPAFTDCD